MPAQFRTQKTDVRSQNRKQGFTLIELMIAISIIAILSAIGMVTYSQSQKLARDSRRKEDLQQIQKALSLYYSDYSSYPKLSALPAGCSNIGGDLYCYSNNATTPWIPPLIGNYINSLPKDPLKDNGDPNSGTNYGYGYMTPVAKCSGAGDGQYFMLFTRLENTSDPDRLGAKDKLLCPQNSISLITQGFNSSLYVITSY